MEDFENRLKLEQGYARGNPFILGPDFLHEGSFLLIFHIDAKTHFTPMTLQNLFNTQKFVMEISADFLNRVERYNLLPMKKGLDQT